jgi:hypothetical protein
MRLLILCVLALTIAPSAFGLECWEASTWWYVFEGHCWPPGGTLSYYYTIPRYSYHPREPDLYRSWAWLYDGWEQGDIVGCWFQPGDPSTSGLDPVDPEDCNHIEQIRVLDFAGYGQAYPGLFTVEFDIWPSDSEGCPTGPSLWSSGPVQTVEGWNFIEIVPPLCIGGCARILVTAEHTGSQAVWGDSPVWGFDNVSTPVLEGIELHDCGCLSALYPRPHVSHYSTMHSGYYGKNFAYCPPQWFRDCRDLTPDATHYGYVELQWSIVMQCLGPSKTEGVTWGAIKAMYR